MLLAPSWFMAFGRRPKVARSLLDTLLFADGSVERCGSRSRDLRRAKPHGLQVERSPAYCARKTGARLRPRGNRNMLKRHRSEEHTSELQSLMRISYAVYRLKK